MASQTPAIYKRLRREAFAHAFHITRLGCFGEQWIVIRLVLIGTE